MATLMDRPDLARNVNAKTTVRVIYRCATCGDVRAYDFRPRAGMRPVLGNLVRFDAADNGLRAPYAYRLCPTCGWRGEVTWKAVKGMVSGTACNEACREAHKDHCTCACGGANHGSAHLVS